MKKRPLIQLTLLFICGIYLLAACSQREPDIDDTFPVDTTSPSTTAPAPTAPVSLGIDPGAYSGSFFDETTQGNMDYYIYIPEQATENMPLIIFLHGIGSVGPLELNQDNAMITQANAIYGEQFPFLILAPSTSIATWASHHIPERLKALTDWVVSEYRVDPERIIITGHSLGSAGVYRMLELYGDYFSAAVPVSEPCVSEVDPTLCTNVRIWGFAGDQEPDCSEAMQQLTQQILELGGNAKFSELPDCNHGKSPYHAFQADVFAWMIE